MKKIGVIQLGLSAAGTFLGAGFISGQEIWSFFGCFGAAGIAGFVANAVLCGVIFYIAVDLVRKTGVEEMGLLMTPGNGRFFAGAVDFLQFLMRVAVWIRKQFLQLFQTVLMAVCKAEHLIIALHTRKNLHQ